METPDGVSSYDYALSETLATISTFEHKYDFQGFVSAQDCPHSAILDFFMIVLRSYRTFLITQTSKVFAKKNQISNLQKQMWGRCFAPTTLNLIILIKVASFSEQCTFVRTMKFDITRKRSISVEVFAFRVF